MPRQRGVLYWPWEIGCLRGWNCLASTQANGDSSRHYKVSTFGWLRSRSGSGQVRKSELS